MTARISFAFVTLALLLGAAAPASATTIGDGFRLEEATIAGTERALRTKRITCTELVAGYLRRINRYERKVNALIAVNPAARTRARALDARLRRSGRPVGPLHCVPVLVKDNYDTAELPTTASSRSLEGSQPPDDAESVARLRRAGAIVLAKANLTEFALTGISFGSLGGQTRNPYDLTRTPGGSSGGTGAGLAANLGLAGTGTDTVNSIRSPASANAVVGIRPTAGLVSRDGVVPLSSSQDAAGPLARTVPGAAALLGVMASYDGRDPITARGVGRREGSYVDGLRPRALRGARIGVLQNFLGTDPELHGPVNRIVDRAARDLRRRGARVRRVALPGGATADSLIASLDVQRFEIRAVLNRYLGSFQAPRRTLTEVIASGGVDARFLPTLRAADALVNGPSEPDYHARLARIASLRDEVLALMADHRLDALVYPQQKRLVVPIGQDQVDRNGILAATTGFPSVAVPAGSSPPTATAPRGVPVGIEVLGRPFTEQRLLSLARDYERATRHRRPPASTP